MKKVLLLMGMLLAAFVVHADEEGDIASVVNLLRSDIKTNKQALVTAAMHFSGAESEAFWPVYRKYESDLSKIGDQQLAMIKDFAANYDSMTADKARELVKKNFDTQQQMINAQKKYVKEFEKAVGPIKTGRFLQVDNQINRLLLLQVAAELPLMQ